MRIDIPPIEVPAIDLATGKWTIDWYDTIKGLERLGLLDLADVSPTAPTNAQVLVWNSTTKLWTPGSN